MSLGLKIILHILNNHSYQTTGKILPKPQLHYVSYKTFFDCLSLELKRW